MKQYYVYILTNAYNSTLYVGVTNNLERRYFEHVLQTNPSSFTAKYKLKKLVYAESCNSIEDAIRREKQLKKWSRQKKIDLINTINPPWINLTDDVTLE